jgi:Fanconi anemia group M protein
MLEDKYITFPYIKKNTVEKRVYQELLTAKAIETSTLVVAPTGLGKTIVAVLLIGFIYNPKKSILFLAPTKPLVSQHKKSLEKVLDVDPDKIILLTGQIPPEKRKEIYSQKGLVICATPQTIDNDIKNNLLKEDNFNLIIFDEAHRAVGEYAYVSISSFFNEETKRLALTASPGYNKQKIKEIADNLKIKHIEIKTESDLDVIDYVKDIEIETVFVELDGVSKKISKLLDSFILNKIELLRKLNLSVSSNFTKKQILMVQQQLFKRLESSKNSLNFVALINVSLALKALYAKELIETQGFLPLKHYLEKAFVDSKSSKTTKTLNQFVNSKEILETYSLLINLDYSKPIYSKEKEIVELVKNFILNNPSSKILIFNNFRDSAQNISNYLNKYDQINSVRFVGQSSKEKDKGLSQKEQAQIISDFRDGLNNVLVCTSVGEEGLDIPSVDLVIFYDAVPSEIRSIQRRGRTGRFNAGKVIILLNKDTIDEHYYYVSLKKEKTMKKNLISMSRDGDLKIVKRKKKIQKNIGDF